MVSTIISQNSILVKSFTALDNKQTRAPSLLRHDCVENKGNMGQNSYESVPNTSSNTIGKSRVRRYTPFPTRCRTQNNFYITTTINANQSNRKEDKEIRHPNTSGWLRVDVPDMWEITPVVRRQEYVTRLCVYDSIMSASARKPESLCM